jgi:hypothetical protein
VKIKLVIVLMVFLFSCYKSEVIEVDVVLDMSAWSPNIGVHNFSLSQQIAYLKPLVRSGNLECVRVGWLGDSSELATWLHSQGIEVLGLFENEFLRDSNVVEIFHAQVQRYPYIKYWEIGNEVEHFIGMSAQEYMAIFDKIYKASRDWGITLLSQAPFGNIDGAEFFKAMMNNGLDKYTDIIVAIHYYGYASEAIHRFSTQVHRLPFSVDVWVTETGIKDQSRHIGYVNEIYPDIRNVLRAKKIFWYVFSECSEHSLVSGLSSGCSGFKITSPLYNFLVDSATDIKNNTGSKIFGTRARKGGGE